MLGHKLVQVLGSRMETWATVRAAELSDATAAVLDPSRTVTGVSVEDLASVDEALALSGALVAINAIGIVKQATDVDDVSMVRVNALFPHELAKLCRSRRVRFIHISTDCVFSGARGAYAERDVPDAVDLYGRSKLLGEVTRPGALTLRTSIVGRELRGRLGLLEWFLGERGGSVRGYSRTVFSGLSTAALAGLVGDVIERHPDLDGLWHAGAEPIDKLSLLSMLRDALGAAIEIEPDAGPQIDRSLDSSRLREAVGWEPPSWQEMVAGLAADDTPYDVLRGEHADR